VISGQAVATGERIARAAATMMSWQLTCMEITVAGTRRTAQPHICRLLQSGLDHPRGEVNVHAPLLKARRLCEPPRSCTEK
jgi:hypothetical protein